MCPLGPKKYLVVTSADLTLALPQRAHHLISYLIKSERDTTVVYRTVKLRSSAKEEHSAIGGKRNLKVHSFPFPSNLLLDPFCVLLLLLLLLLAKRQKYHVGISLNLPAGILCTILRKIDLIERSIDNHYILRKPR